MFTTMLGDGDGAKVSWLLAALVAAGSSTSAVAAVAVDTPWDFVPREMRQLCIGASAPPPFSSNSSRWVYLALPAGPAPQTGWPVFVSFEVEGFASGRGQPKDGAPLCGNGSSLLNSTVVRHGAFTAYAAWATPKESLEGYFAANGSYDERGLSRSSRPDYPIDVWDGVAGGLWMQRVKQLLIARGIAVLSVNPYAVDSIDWDPVSWETGLDRPFYTELFRQLRAGVLGPLDLQRLIFRGYSAGAQMSSWFAELYAHGEPGFAGTRMVGGVVISGGSYACYGSSNASDGAR